jgi:hypothetical protein
LSIYVVNKSKLVTNRDAMRMTRAVSAQVNRYMFSIRMKQTHVQYISETPPEGNWVIAIADEPDQADALGYHYEENGLAAGFVFAKPVFDNGGSSLDAGPDGVSVSTVLSHEVLETVTDPTTNRWVQIEGSTFQAMEVCDPVEGDSYCVRVYGTDIWVSDFVFPQYFDPQSEGPYDAMGLLKRPFEVRPTGYAIIMKDGNTTENFGESYPKWRQELKQSSRRLNYRKAQ